ncbi:FecR family protein [Mucilaginibacter sp.]|jgi:ferric-dicitrate binding protein FerR (iron transport regulator)|uniref:FecR family protein n=1 Tax=Mucilaginibacter sp. TaxID=1882438 RepID=UPI003562F41F
MVNDRFIQLLTTILTDELDPKEQEEFNYLLEDNELNKLQYNFFKTYWVQDQEQYSNSDLMFQQIRSKITLPEEGGEATNTKRSKVKTLTILISIAAILIVALGTGLFFYFNRQPDLNNNAKLELIKTPSRVKSKIVLSDGTVVTLNSETRLKYPPEFKGKTREVYLDGEAFFDVKKDHQHPFIVHTGKMRVRVLGTAFNIKSYANDVASETSLIRGAIEVTLTDRPSDRIILKPNEKLVIRSTPVKGVSNKKSKVVLNHDSVNTSYALTTLTYLRSNDTAVVETSWVNNRLVFKDEEFKDIANQMERWYGIKIKFKNSNVEKYRFTGVFDKESIYQALKALQMIEPFTYKQENGTVYIFKPVIDLRVPMD